MTSSKNKKNNVEAKTKTKQRILASKNYCIIKSNEQYGLLSFILMFFAFKIG